MRQDLPFAHLLILILLFFIAVNLFILDLKIFYPSSFFQSEYKTENLKSRLSGTPQEAGVPESLPVNFNSPQSSCPASCIDLINTSTSSSNFGNIKRPVSELGTVTANTAKEYFIPLGSGETSKNDWDNLVSTETVINPSVYGQLKEAYFIVSLKNPTQNGAAEVRLQNVTDNNVVYGSHLVMNGPLEQTLSSGAFALPTASKLYRIQIKSTLSYPVTLSNARLKLLAQ